MQIGQILVAQRWVEPAELARALAEQRLTGKRICSLLIARCLLDRDHAARALANQHNVPGVLQKHLDNRDPSLAALLPAALARASVALPIGRARSHELIICVRDPRPELARTLASAVGGPVVIAVAPAHQLEQLIKQVYNAPIRRPAPTDDDDGVDVDLTTRQIPVIGDPLGNLRALDLVGLDDERVAKDPSQSGQHAAVLPRTMTLSPPRTTASPVLPARTTLPPPSALRTTTPPGTTAPLRPIPPSEPPPLAPGPSIDATLSAIEQAVAPDDAVDTAMWFLSQRFRRAVWFTIHDGFALGERGHGDALTLEMIQAITLPLNQPSIVQLAHDTRRLATAAPAEAGAIQDRLARTLGNPRSHAAVPIEVGARVTYVLVVGDASHEPDAAAHELALLGRALGAAYQRTAQA